MATLYFLVKLFAKLTTSKFNFALFLKGGFQSKSLRGTAYKLIASPPIYNDSNFIIIPEL